MTRRARGRPRAPPARESPLVGRDNELATLETLYERVVREGAPHLVTLVGEAGVGKSRLLREFERRLGARPDAPTFRTGRCLPYGTGIVFWALGEVIRAGVRDRRHRLRRRGLAQAARLRARRCSSGRASRAGDRGGRAQGRADRPPARPRGARRAGARRARTRSACASRSSPRCAPASRRWAGARPLVLAFEDIHWADDGMLDAIEHLAQWVRAPLHARLPGPRRAARPAAGLGRRARARRPSCCSTRSAAGRHRALVAALLPDGETVLPGGGGALRRQPAVRRGDGAPHRRGGRHARPPSCPTPCRPCSPRGSTRSSPSSGGWCSRRRWWAARSGRARWRRWRSSEGRDLGPGAARRSRRRTSSPPAPRAGWPASASWPSSTC